MSLKKSFWTWTNSLTSFLISSFIFLRFWACNSAPLGNALSTFFALISSMPSREYQGGFNVTRWWSVAARPYRSDPDPKLLSTSVCLTYVKCIDLFIWSADHHRIITGLMKKKSTWFLCIKNKIVGLLILDVYNHLNQDWGVVFG